MVRKLIVIMVCLLLTVSIGCSKKSQYQFALDAVAAKPEFDKDKGHWAWQYSDFRGKRIPSLEYTSHWTFLLGALKGKIPTEGEIVVCWQDKGKGVFLSTFNQTSQMEQSTQQLTVECQ